MKIRFPKYLLPSLLLISLLLLAYAKWQITTISPTTQVEVIKQKIQQIVSKEQLIVQQISTQKYDNLPNFPDYYVALYQHDSLIKWDNSENVMTQNISSIKNGTTFQHLSNGYYLVTKKTIANYTYAVFKPIYLKYYLTNKFLKNEWLIDFAHKEKLEITEQPHKKQLVVTNQNNEFYFYVNEVNENLFEKVNMLALFLFFLMIIVALLNISRLINWINFKLKWDRVILLQALWFVAFYWFMQQFVLNDAIFQTDLFNPEIYASEYFSSLGNLTFFTIIFCWCLVFFSFKSKQIFSAINHSLYSVFAISFTLIVLRFIIQSLVKDSNISFSVFDKNSINLFSFIGILVISFLLSTVYLILRNWITKIASINYSIVLLLLLSVIAAAYFNHNLELKNKSVQKLIVQKLSDERDVATEFLFNESYEKLLKDNYLKDILLHEKSEQNKLTKYIKQKYFKGYFDKFNIEFYVLRGNQKVADYRFKNLDSICTNANNISNGLFYAENKSSENQYYSKTIIKDSNKILATIFISFNAKSFKKDKIYPSLIIEQKANSTDYLEQINFAIYSHHQLIRQSGNFAFPLALSTNEIPNKSEALIFKKDKFENLIVQSESGKIIWITNYDKDLFQYLSLFGLLLIITFLIVVIVISSTHYQQFTTFNFSFRNKVLLVISSITFLILISTAVLFAIFYVQQFNDLMRINLSYKINNVQKDLMLSIDNSVHKKKFHSVDETSIDDLIQHLSDVHDVDINLFEPNGDLKISSQALIYENGILNPKINFKILQSIIKDKKSLIFNDEKIGNLNFLSAYLPITNDKNEVKYILSIPYFFREKELTDNFNNLVITLLNLYLLLILVAILTAIFISNNLTKSFEIIRTKLAALTLGKRNEPIVWYANDEIGALVNEYNKMIAELENSTTKLAQSERESAWREMARQVAHEIKNPLTPMKLSVQLLERAIKDKRDDVNEMTIKVSKTLIEQIDNLTHIATQFSQFAKMGSSNIEEFNIVDILKNVVDLFGQHNPLVQVIFKSTITETIIKADKNQCVSVFNNLVLNAIQSIADDTEGQVIVHHFIENDKCIITITDTGCGIEPDKLERIFEPNFTTKTSGTGLGLAISKTIIEGVGGSITVTSQLEKGTEFRIEFGL